MWYTQFNSSRGHAKFFLIGLSHDSLVNYYQLNFQLIHHYHYSLTEIDSLIPWEREIYIELLMNFLKEEEQRQQNG